VRYSILNDNAELDDSFFRRRAFFVGCVAWSTHGRPVALRKRHSAERFQIDDTKDSKSAIKV
jgi:hypothetical protein